MVRALAGRISKRKLKMQEQPQNSAMLSVLRFMAILRKHMAIVIRLWKGSEYCNLPDILNGRLNFRFSEVFLKEIINLRLKDVISEVETGIIFLADNSLSLAPIIWTIEGHVPKFIINLNAAVEIFF